MALNAYELSEIDMIIEENGNAFQTSGHKKRETIAIKTGLRYLYRRVRTSGVVSISRYSRPRILNYLGMCQDAIPVTKVRTCHISLPFFPAKTSLTCEPLLRMAGAGPDPSAVNHNLPRGLRQDTCRR